jgi:RNase P subunit RPR2
MASWMFFNGPADHLHTKSEDDLKTLSELFPQHQRTELIDALEKNHGDVTAASNWLVNKESSHDPHHTTPVPSPPQPSRMRFACGHCSTIFSTELPSSTEQRLTATCPTCGIENIIPTESVTHEHEPQPQPHYSSWMHLHPSDDLSQSQSYSHRTQINQNDVLKVMELFPECNRIQIEEALRVAHGDMDLACDWILAHNEYPESSGPSVTYYHPPAPVACVIRDRNIQSSVMNVSCGNCSHLMSIALPITSIQPGSQLSSQCPECGMMNIIPLRKMSRAVIF